MNISKERREKLLNYLEKLKEGKEDEDIRIISEIEKALNEKKYGLVWEEHSEKVDEELKTNIPVFKEVEERKIEKDKEKAYNFLLEGDNLHSLRLLEKTHKGKIDVIYIDPPYNTGNKDFIYNDQYVDKTDGYSHSKWLSFMEKRLRIARELLIDDGIIYISIDDNELFQLKLLCDEIFGGANFIANFTRTTRKGGGSMSKYVSTDHEYILLYSKDITKKNRFYVPFDEKYLKRYNESDDNGKYFWDTFARNRQGSSNIYKIEFPNGELVENSWIYKKEKFLELLKKGDIRFKKIADGKYSLQIKQRLNENGQIMRSEIRDYPNSLGTKTLVNLIGKDKFNYAKPIELIMYILSFSNKNSTILDFFAGSGTTGHAVAKLNVEDGGNRKYILCTNNENNICEDVTYKRLSNIQEELPHNLKYYKVDYVSKSDEEVYEKLNEHIQEMVNLEEGKEVKVIYDEEEVEKVLEESSCDSSVYIMSGIMLSGKEQKIVEKKRIKIKEVPEIYYRNELKELGEI
ncbi:site-specific DNA-methyltransferase [Sneathia sanguinegens]|uniref:site-specific DNA-methyltransferase n=1 Tax=Sneathia sanguinegens TaxID=40543 RepID=UPI00082D32AA|nr:DNA methyltransferase [Sneathia sanguinegens]